VTVRHLGDEPESYRIALRPDYNGELDDVVVRDVKLFRLERMGDDAWWMALYLSNEAHEELVFWIRRGRPRETRGREVVINVTQLPEGDHVYEPGSMGAT
jgi:hypothetical protein